LPVLPVPNHFGKNLDALFDCMTDLVHRPAQPGFVVVLEQLPDNPRSTVRRANGADVFRDGDFWAERKCLPLLLFVRGGPQRGRRFVGSRADGPPQHRSRFLRPFRKMASSNFGMNRF
jgi:hypothetical protein